MYLHIVKAVHIQAIRQYLPP